MMSDDRPVPRLLLGFALALFIMATSVDLISDQPESWLSLHVVLEVVVIAAAMLAGTVLWLGWRRSRHDASGLRTSLEQRSRERDAWESSARRALAGLAEHVNAEFDSWGLTPAEREVALLLLKGRSHKQIALATGRSERTARQHAAAVYQKAGLTGRAGLAGHFLDELILPGSPDRGNSPQARVTAGTDTGI